MTWKIGNTEMKMKKLVEFVQKKCYLSLHFPSLVAMVLLDSVTPSSEEKAFEAFVEDFLRFANVSVEDKMRKSMESLASRPNLKIINKSLPEFNLTQARKIIKLG